MRRLVLLVLLGSLPGAAEVPGARPAASPTSERSRLGGEYFVQRAGASWTYQVGKGRARWAITSFADWRASFTFSFGKRSGGGTWRVKDGAWLERGGQRGDVEGVVLPAVMTRGTRWTSVASIERGTTTQSTYEVVALDALVELPTGVTMDQCLAVLETNADGSEPYTHYFAPNVGKVAVRGPEDWVLRLVEFRSGQRRGE